MIQFINPNPFGHKTFTLLQLFTVVDGRLSTTEEDVAAILKHLFGVSFHTHEMPVAIRFLKERAKPDWYIIMTADIESMKIIHKHVKIDSLLEIIKHEYNFDFPIPPLTALQMSGLHQYMVDNSLLASIGSQGDAHWTFSSLLERVRKYISPAVAVLISYILIACGSPTIQSKETDHYEYKTVRVLGSYELLNVYMHRLQQPGDTIEIERGYGNIQVVVIDTATWANDRKLLVNATPNRYFNP